MTPCRLLVDPPASGPWNMAVDQTLLESTTQTGHGCLRFYRWSQPTLSLGYFQKNAHRSQHSSSQQCRLIRRSSGGGAIVHDHELTYSLTLRCQDSRRRESLDLVEIVHQALVDVLTSWGIHAELYRESSNEKPSRQPFLCFQRRAGGDVVLQGFKVLGSAQRRFKHAILQHGSLLLKKSHQAPELPGLEDFSNQQRRFSHESLIHKWCDRLSSKLELAFYEGELSAQEIHAAKQLQKKRFENPRWTCRR